MAEQYPEKFANELEKLVADAEKIRGHGTFCTWLTEVRVFINRWRPDYRNGLDWNTLQSVTDMLMTMADEHASKAGTSKRNCA